LTPAGRIGPGPEATPEAVVVLVGLMGSGKSTVGRLVAERWGCPFVDLDREIERLSGLSIAEIFRTEGEAGFRRREAAATLGLLPNPPLVIAVGGGWMACPELRGAWPGAVRVWLRVPPAEAARRLAGADSDRPLLAEGAAEERLASLLAARLPAYGLADYTVDASDRTPEEVARVVAGLFEGGRARPAGPAGPDDNDQADHVET
jgi:shikimate kinase